MFFCQRIHLGEREKHKEERQEKEDIHAPHSCRIVIVVDKSGSEPSLRRLPVFCEGAEEIAFVIVGIDSESLGIFGIAHSDLKDICFLCRKSLRLFKGEACPNAVDHLSKGLFRTLQHSAIRAEDTDGDRAA